MKSSCKLGCQDSATQKTRTMARSAVTHLPGVKWLEKRASCPKVQPMMLSKLFGSGLCGWLVLCWFIADHAWYVSLETQITTDINWNSECLSNCFQNSGLLIWTAANHCNVTSPQSFCVRCGWILDIINQVSIGCSGRQSLGVVVPECHRGPSSAILVLIHIKNSILHGATMEAVSALHARATSLDVTSLSIGHTGHELKWQRPLLTGHTPLCHAGSRWLASVVLFVSLFDQGLARFTCSLTIGQLGILSRKTYARMRTPRPFRNTTALEAVWDGCRF